MFQKQQSYFLVKARGAKKNDLAEIIPFEPETVKTGEGKYQFDRTLVINNLILKCYEKFLDKATHWKKEYYSNEFR